MSSPPPPLLCPCRTCNIAVQNYRTAVARLVNKLDIAAVNELVIIIPAFGWTSFILTTPLGGRSHSRGREGIHTQNDARKITLMAASAVSASTARGISPSDVGECKNAATSANESGSSTGSDGRLVGRLVGDSEVIGRGIVPPGVSLATSLMEKTNGD